MDSAPLKTMKRRISDFEDFSIEITQIETMGKKNSISICEMISNGLTYIQFFSSHQKGQNEYLKR